MSQATTTRRRALAARAATFAGATVRRIGLGLPGTVGPGLVVVSLVGWDWRIGTLAAGVILWALDRRVP